MVASRLALIAVQIFAIVRGPTPLQKARERGCSVLRYGEGRTMSWGWGPYITSSWKDRNGQRKKNERKAQSKVLDRKESHQYGGDILMYGKGAFKMTQGVGE